MDIKWIGAILIVLGCGGFGFSMAAAHRREEYDLRQLIAALDYMECELQYRMTPLPDLCNAAGREIGGQAGTVLLRLSEELNQQVSPDVAACMENVLRNADSLSGHTLENLKLLGNSLGRFDLKGQLSGLESVRGACRQDLAHLSQNRENRLRSYQTLGLCAGAALAILLI